MRGRRGKRRTYATKVEVVGGDGEGNGGEENEELGPEEDLLDVGEEVPEQSAGHLGHERQIRFLAQRRRRHVVRGAPVPVVHQLLAQRRALEVASLQRLIPSRIHDPLLASSPLETPRPWMLSVWNTG